MRKPPSPRRLRLARPVVAGLAAAIVAAAAAATEDPDAHRRALLQQKTRLVEQLLGSARARAVAEGTDTARQSDLARARETLDSARQALDAGDAARAQAGVDEALRLTTGVVAARGPSSGDEVLRQRNAELRHQVGTFRGALAAALPSAGTDATTLETIDRLVAEAERASATERHQDAHQALTQAYQAATSTLSSVWAGRTITLERRFETPADEYRHEAARYRSHDALVDLAVTERRPDAAARAEIEQARARAREVLARAESRAAAGDHPAAITLMDEATGELLRALQAAGVPRF